MTGCRDGSEVKSACCSVHGLEFSSSTHVTGLESEKCLKLQFQGIECHFLSYTHASIWTHTHVLKHRHMLKWNESFKSILYLKIFLYNTFWTCFFISSEKSHLFLSLPGSCFQSSRALNYKDGESLFGETGQIWFYWGHSAANRVVTINQLIFLANLKAKFKIARENAQTNKQTNHNEIQIFSLTCKLFE